ncbi:MAG: hypothetical protein P1U89_18170 [Verrucomicrobiales bacterium]|nr:hypothetical protein [Verrucomicrobiales bacterium]
MSQQTTIHHNSERFGLASILAVCSAILSFVTGPILGMFFAVFAILLGVVGILAALSPKTRGGFASTMAIGAGVIGIIAAVIKALMWIF